MERTLWDPRPFRCSMSAVRPEASHQEIIQAVRRFAMGRDDGLRDALGRAPFPEAPV